jgi:hypothetical protein
MTEAVLSSALFANPKHLNATDSDTNIPVCYMLTKDGKAINLQSICEKSKAFRIAITGVTREGDHVTGQVTNRTSKMLFQARIKFHILDETERIVDQKLVFTQPQMLAPGQTAKFEVFIPSGRDIRPVFAEGTEKH